MHFGSFLNFKPFICPGCRETSREMICRSCLSSLRKNHDLLHPQNDGILGIFPIFISYSTTHRILVYWKDRGGENLKRILFSPSPELLSRMESLKFDLIIPIPQNESRSLKRGHASAIEVARLFSKMLGVPVEQELKLKEIQIEKQANLSEWERRHSENPFACNPLPSHLNNILLVDDFITTGSTLDKAANAIHAYHPEARIHAGALGWKPRALQ